MAASSSSSSSRPPSSSSREFAEHIADLLRPLGEVTVARFFGGQQLRVGAEQIAMVHDGELYFRVIADSLREELRQGGGEAFYYETSKRTISTQRYFGAPVDWIEDPERLVDFARRNLAHLIAEHRDTSPAPATKKKRSPRKKKSASS